MGSTCEKFLGRYLDMNNMVDFFEKIFKYLHLPPSVSIVIFGISFPSLAYWITTLPFVEAFNTNLSTWFPIITALVYLGSLIYIPKGKLNKNNICLMLVMHSPKDHELLQGSIFHPLDSGVSDLHFVTPRLFARLFFNYITSTNNISTIKNLYMRYVHRRSMSSLIVGGDIRCIAEQNKLLYKFHIDFMSLSDTKEHLSYGHISAFSETVHSFKSIKEVIDLYIRFIQETSKPPSYDTLLNISKYLHKISEIEKSGLFDKESIEILSPAFSLTIKYFSDFTPNSNPPNYSTNLELWKICDLILHSNSELSVELISFYHSFIFEAHDDKVLNFLAEHFTIQNFDFNDTHSNHILCQIEKAYCYLILGDWEKAMNVLKNVYGNASFESNLSSFKNSLKQPCATEYTQLLDVLFDICKSDNKSAKKALKSLIKQNPYGMATQILNQI